MAQTNEDGSSGTDLQAILAAGGAGSSSIEEPGVQPSVPGDGEPGIQPVAGDTPTARKGAGGDSHGPDLAPEGAGEHGESSATE